MSEYFDVGCTCKALIEANRVELLPGARAVPEYYGSKSVWPAESLARRAAVLG